MKLKNLLWMCAGAIITMFLLAWWFAVNFTMNW